MKIVFGLANSVDPDEMSHHATFHLGLYCLPKYLFRQRVKGVYSVLREPSHENKIL